MSQMIESFMTSTASAGLRVQPVEFDEAASPPESGAALLRDAHPLHAVKVRLHVRVGEAAMTVGDLLSARENATLVLDRTVDEPVDLLLEGKVVARGQLVTVDGGTFAVRITELPVPLKI